MMTSKRILMRTERKTNRSRKKIIFGIFYRPRDMAELAGPGGVEQELRTFLEQRQFSSCYSLISYYAQFIHSSSWVEDKNSISDSGAVNGFLYLVNDWVLIPGITHVFATRFSIPRCLDADVRLESRSSHGQGSNDEFSVAGNWGETESKVRSFERLRSSLVKFSCVKNILLLFLYFNYVSFYLRCNCRHNLWLFYKVSLWKLVALAEEVKSLMTPLSVLANSCSKGGQRMTIYWINLCPWKL